MADELGNEAFLTANVYGGTFFFAFMQETKPRSLGSIFKTP